MTYVEITGGSHKGNHGYIDGYVRNTLDVPCAVIVVDKKVVLVELKDIEVVL